VGGHRGESGRTADWNSLFRVSHLSGELLALLCAVICRGNVYFAVNYYVSEENVSDAEVLQWL